MSGTGPNSGNSEANTSNVYNSSTSIGGSIGFTGDQGANVLNVLTRNVANSLNQLGYRVQTTLGDIARQGTEQHRTSMELASFAVDRSATMFERTALNSTSTLNGIVNAVRDSSQRIVNASVGQASPIQQLEGASQYAGTAPGSDKVWMIAGVVIAFIALMNSKG